MALTLVDPELKADAQRLISFASSVAESSMALYEYASRGVDKESPEFKELHAYFLKNGPKLKDIVDTLLADLG